MENIDLKAILPVKRAKQIRELYDEYLELHDIINDCGEKDSDVFPELSNVEIDQWEKRARAWVATFSRATSTRPNDWNNDEMYSEDNITPYMHAWMNHAPQQLRRFKNIRKFSSDTVEGKNGDDIRFFFNGTQKGGGKGFNSVSLAIGQKDNRTLYFLLNADKFADAPASKRPTVMSFKRKKFMMNPAEDDSDDDDDDDDDGDI
eukprot:Lithocolla_globosa_v1_NODE_933_length_3063_cov_11.302859.p2 type:complete len:204 gc:universal NODE_933_length_3063_cov_11.302859:2353-2964(+)